MGHPRHQAAYLLKNMKVISAYMLAVVGGNAKPSAADVKKILSSVSIDLDADETASLESLVEEMTSKDLAEVLKAGHEKLKTVPGGGSAGPAAAGGAGPAKEEEEDDDDADMAPATNLFGDEGDDY